MPSWSSFLPSPKPLRYCDDLASTIFLNPWLNPSNLKDPNPWPLQIEIETSDHSNLKLFNTKSKPQIDRRRCYMLSLSLKNHVQESQSVRTHIHPCGSSGWTTCGCPKPVCGPHIGSSVNLISRCFFFFSLVCILSILEWIFELNFDLYFLKTNIFALEASLMHK